MNKEMTLEEALEYTKEQMRVQCRATLASINHQCAYEGHSLSEYKEAYDACKEFLRYGYFPSCYNEQDKDDD